MYAYNFCCYFLWTNISAQEFTTSPFVLVINQPLGNVVCSIFCEKVCADRG